MGHKDYSNFSKHSNKNTEQNNDVIDGQITIDEIVEHDQETTEDNQVNKTVIGVVDGCEKLNMRKDFNKESDIVTIIAKGTELTINLSESTDDFYKVCTAAGIEGYCMKKFISIS